MTDPTPAHDHQLGHVCLQCVAEEEPTPEGLDRLLAAVMEVDTRPWPLRALSWVYGRVCNAYARVLLRDPSFTIAELRDLHGLADEELPPHLAAQAQRIITAEISRRTRKDY